MLLKLLGLGIWTATIYFCLYKPVKRLFANRELAVSATLLVSLPLAFFARGLFNDTTFASPCLAYLLASGWRPNISAKLLLAILCILGIAISLGNLGLVPELYEGGYFPNALGLILTAILILIAYKDSRLIAGSIILTIAMGANGLWHSPNIWDCIVDLPTAILAATILTKQLKKQRILASRNKGDKSSVQENP